MDTQTSLPFTIKMRSSGNKHKSNYSIKVADAHDAASTLYSNACKLQTCYAINAYTHNSDHNSTIGIYVAIPLFYYACRFGETPLISILLTVDYNFASMFIHVCYC